MIDLFQKGGIIMVIILGISFVGLMIILERLIYFRRIRVDEAKMLNRIKITLEKGHFDEALSICENNPSFTLCKRFQPIFSPADLGFTNSSPIMRPWPRTSPNSS